MKIVSCSPPDNIPVYLKYHSFAAERPDGIFFVFASNQTTFQPLCAPLCFCTVRQCLSCLHFLLCQPSTSQSYILQVTLHQSDLDLWSLETFVMTGRVAAGNVDKLHCQKYEEKTPVPLKKQTRTTTFPFCVAGNLPLFA